MPRPKSTTPSYCLHKRSGRAYATIDGQERWFPGLHNSDESKGAYDRLIAEWLSNGRTLANKSGGAMSVGMVALAFWNHAESHYVTADGKPTGEAENYRVATSAVEIYANGRYFTVTGNRYHECVGEINEPPAGAGASSCPRTWRPICLSYAATACICFKSC